MTISSQLSLVYEENVFQANPKKATCCLGLTISRKRPRSVTVSKVFQSIVFHSLFRGNASTFFDHLFHLIGKRSSKPLDLTLETAKENGMRKLGIAADATWGNKRWRLSFTRSLWVGACNSAIFLSRRFHRPICFLIEFPWNKTPVGVRWPITRN